MSEHVHDWQPLEKVRAAYRCACGALGYKPHIRTNVGLRNHIEPYKCYHIGCTEPVLWLNQVVSGRRQRLPTCKTHRKD